MNKQEVMQDIIEKAQRIQLLILDVDGVLTDGRLFFDNRGNEYKSFHARDGFGIRLLRENGIEVAVISGRKSKTVALRMKQLGIGYVYQGYDNKLSAFDDILGKLNLTPDRAAFVGDDLIDLPVMSRVALAIAVDDANIAVKQRADWCTRLPGGQGAVREVCDLILSAQGRLSGILDFYLA